MLAPETLAQLQPVIADAVGAALRAFFLGRQRSVFTLDPRSASAAPINFADEWRSAMANRYAAGSWNRDVIELMPFALFEPRQIDLEELRRRHPGREHPASGLANALKALVDDGVLAKAFRAMYAPAIDGVAIV